jgi:hypothetical protein
MEKPESLAKPRGFQCLNCAHIWKNTYSEHVWRPWVKKQGPSLEQELDSLRMIAKGRRRK